MSVGHFVFFFGIWTPLLTILGRRLIRIDISAMLLSSSELNVFSLHSDQSNVCKCNLKLRTRRTQISSLYGPRYWNNLASAALQLVDGMRIDRTE
jgi:hypothetical protein